MATTNFSWATPTVGGSENTWGDTLNATLEAIDGEVANRQPLDAGLTSIAALTTAADRMIYTTASDTYAVATLTSAGRALLDDANAAAQRTTLGLGTAAVEDAAAGTWTVQISDDSANVSSTTATGRYYTIGDLVFAFIPAMANISTAGLTAGDGIRISLPFSAAANYGGGGEIVSSSWASFAGGGDGNLKISVAVGSQFARIVNDGGIAQPATNLLVSNINSGVTDINGASVVYVKA